VENESSLLGLLLNIKQEIVNKICCIFDKMALYFQCRINKKRAPSDCFLAILPTGLRWVDYMYLDNL